MITLKLTPNPAVAEKSGDRAHAASSSKNGTDSTGHGANSNSAATVMGDDDTSPRAQFACPIAKREMNGRYRFAFSRRCGCVVSDQVLREIKEPTCLVVSHHVVAAAVAIVIPCLTYRFDSLV